MEKEKVFKIWDAAGRERLASGGHAGYVMNLAFSPEGKSIISSAAKGSISQGEREDPTFVRVTDVATGRTDREIRTGAKYITGLAATRKSTTVAVDTSEVAQGWDVSDGSEIFSIAGPPDRRYGGGFPPVQSSFGASADGLRLVALSASSDREGEPIDRVVSLWDAAQRNCRVLDVKSGPLRSVAISSDGSIVLVATVDQRILAFDFASEQRIFAFYPGPGIGGVGPYFLTFSPDGTRFVIGKRDGVLRMFESKHGRYIDSIRGPRTYIRAVAFLPDRLRILSGGYNEAGTVKQPNGAVDWKYEPLWVWDTEYRQDSDHEEKGFRHPE